MVPQWSVCSTFPAARPHRDPESGTEHILGGYRFLMENYKPGDRICVSSTEQTPNNDS